MADVHPSSEEHRLAACLERLSAGDQKARDDLIAIACERMRGIAHRMLRTFPRVRRWDETDDVVQNAALRLYKSLGKFVPEDARGFIGLTAVQVRRELLDLAKKHAGPESYAANHETNYRRMDGELRAKVDDAPDQGEALERIARWTLLHETAASLPEDERELFHLVWYLGLKQKEAAGVLGCSVRTVKRLWDQAKGLMATAMQDGLPE
jgi:RNA polymerase sigma factor (sigma-70 family)